MKSLADRIRNVPPEKHDRMIWIAVVVVVVIMIAVWIIVGNGRKPKADQSLQELVKQQFNESREQYKEFQTK